MKANLRKLRKQRRYSEEFKRNLVNDFERGNFTILELSKLHQVGYQTIYTWVYKYSNLNHKSIQIVEMKDSSTKKLKDQEKKIRDLERVVGQKQLYIDYLEKMMEIAKEELGVDIKKKYDTPQSTGLEQTKRK